MSKERSKRVSEQAEAPAGPARGMRTSREETTERILDAAEELFSARNPREVTVRQIAQRAGVTHALVHQYVGTKDDLLNAVIQRVAVDRTQLVRQCATVHEALRASVQQVLTNRMHSRTLVRSAMDGVEYLSLKDRIPTGQALLTLASETAASGAQPATPPRDVEPGVVLAAVTSLAFGWGAIEDWLWPIFELDPADKDDIYRQLGEITEYLANLILECSDSPADLR